MSKVRITVLRKAFYEDMAEKYLTEGKAVGPCPLHEEGDAYVYEGGAQMPEGLCPWAWIDIYRGVSAFSAGASNAPWNNKGNQTVYCCTDGIRPVTFLIERMES